MIKIELEKAIENGESVWVINKDNVIFEIELNEETCAVKDNVLIKNYSHPEFYKPKQICFIEYCFSIKAEAEHYLHHANITRTETLPFLTWEEFKEGKELRFYNGKYRYKMNWSVDPEIIVIKRYLDFDIDEFIFNERLTESNFYRAYDECVKLFKQE